MNGIEKITRLIQSEAQMEIDGVLARAREEAAETAARYEAQAQAEAAELAAKNQRAAAEREERLVSAAQMEARKTLLAAKQELVERAYGLALERLCALPEETYVQVLAELMVRASSTGREEVLLSPGDRERVGRAAVARANELLVRRSAPELPEELTSTKVGAILDKVAAGVSAMVQGTALLTLSQETRDIRGGCILKNGNVEVNCAFETLVRLQRAETAGAVAKQLFPEG